MQHLRVANICRLAGALLLFFGCSPTGWARPTDIVNVGSVSFAGLDGTATLPTNVVRARRDDSVPPGITMFVQKSASRDEAEIGDFVDFTVTVKNVVDVTVSPIVLEDRLPFGFSYEKGTARLNGTKIPDPAGGSGPDLSFPVGALEAGRTATLTYRTRVGIEAMRGDGINRAQARTNNIPPDVSNIAACRVHLRSGVFTTRGIILGKVFVDTNHNRIQDGDEPGIPGVRLYLEDGTYVITDSEGKYSFYGISARTHMVKLDRTTLPSDAVLEPLDNRNAGNGGSVFAELKFGELRKVNFAVANATSDMMDYVSRMRAAAEATAKGEAETSLKAPLNKNASQVLALDRRSLPSSGLVYPGVAVQPTTQDRSQSSDAFILGGSRMDVGPVAGPGMHGFSSLAPTRSEQPAPLTPYGGNNGPAPAPGVSLEQAVSLDQDGGQFGFVELRDNDTLPVAQTTIRVKGVLGGKLLLRVNGREIPQSRIGKRMALTNEGIDAVEYIGVELQPGVNKLELAQFDQFGNNRGSKTITVIAPDKLGTIRITTPDNALADGKTPARILVDLVDRNGVRVTARTSLTLETTMGKWLTPDLNPREPGVQVFIEGGHGEFDLAPPVEPGDSRIRISSGALKADAIVSFFPELRPLIAAGLVEGVINIRNLNSSALRPTNASDTFDRELRQFAVSGNNGSAAGRAAFFLKGKILGSYLLTAAYDSEKQTRTKLFRDIQPDQFYPVYGDSSIKGFEAQSTSPLYVRIDNKKSYLLYGDFVTQGPNDIRQLGNYNRSLNGVREHLENKNVSANLWASYDNSRQVVEELPANGTSGPYAFHSATGLINSEKVEVITRDRNNPGLIIKTVTMTRFSDYEFEPLTGQLLFKAPIPSLDPDLNPISIRMTYEINQGGDRFWVYGADVDVKINDRVQVGGSFARDENPTDHYGLYSGNAVFDLGMKTFLFGEFAHSVDDIAGDGNAERIELRHNSDKLFARIFWGRADDHFKNQTAILTAGRTEGGAQISYQFSKKTRAIIQAVDTQAQDGGTRRGVLAGVEQTFGKNIRFEIDGRYSNETATPASPSTASPPGVTPNEVRSLRTKLTLPLPWTDGNGRIYGEYEQDLVEDKRLAAVGGDYQLDTKTRFYFRHEFISSLGGPFELNTIQSQNSTVFGIESTYAKDASFFNEYRVRDAITGGEAEAAIGLRNAWTLADGLRAQTTFERIEPSSGSSTTDESTAITGALEYTGDPDWKGTARLELRTSETVDSLLNSLGLAYKLSDDWTALGKSVVYIADNKGSGATDQRQARIQIGAAWRQTKTDVWNALGKYEFRTENGPPGLFDGTTSTPSTATSEVNRRVNIVSLDVNYQPNADWLMSGHYAGKLVFDDSDKHDDFSNAHLLIGHITRDLTKRVDVGLNLSALLDGNGRSAHFGVGPEIGITLAENVRVGLGYNFQGFTDRDLTEEQYTQHGVYLALRLKWDEQLFQRHKQEDK